MWKYPVSPELVAPAIDLGRLKLDGFIVRALGALIRLDARLFAAPRGTRLTRTSIPGYRDARLACVVIEPDPPVRDAPGILYFHGGGFVFPTQTLMLGNAAAFALGAGATVILPEYRLAIDFPFSAPAEDCYASLLWAVQNAETLGIDPARIILYGESAGGCLAAAVTLMAKDRGGPEIRSQMLVYPVTDSSQTGESLKTYSEGLWPASANRRMWELYMRNGDFGMPGYASPLQAENLGGLPPAYIELAEIDSLFSEGQAYARRLEASGCEVTVDTIPGAFHGWDMERGSPLTKRVLARRCSYIDSVTKLV
ncbi:MAG TPA: alpha/beta hydrolase [Rectinemataceae bacterium]